LQLKDKLTKLDPLSLLSYNGFMEVRVKKLQKYITENGRCPFDEWVESLGDKRTQAIVVTRLNRVVQGNYGLCKSLGGGIW
jgi:hypothetical protein